MREGLPLAIDLYCGAGGLSQGLKSSGLNVVLAIDKDPGAYRVYRENNLDAMALWSEIERIRNFQTLLGQMGFSYKEIDVVAGGPPCQGFSVANKQTRGPNNGKAELLKFYDAVKQIHPPVFLMENVVGLLSIDEGRLVNEMMSHFENIGYVVDTRILDAADFGVPQHRKRIFMVGSTLGKFRFPKETHGPKADRSYVTVGEAIVGDLPPIDGTKGERVSSYFAEPTSYYQKRIRRGNRLLYDHVVTINGEIVKRRIKLIGKGVSFVDLVNGGRVPKELLISIDHKSVYRRLDPNVPSVTVGCFRKAMLIHPEEDRLLSLREAARLQSFSDGYRFSGRLGSMQQVVGDAIPPMLSRSLSRMIRRLILGRRAEYANNGS